LIVFLAVTLLEKVACKPIIINNRQAYSVDKFRLEDVDSLVFEWGKTTAYHRTSPIPQLQCIGGPCTAVHFNYVTCFRKYFGLQLGWECKAEMPDGYTFGTAEVSCEGFDFPEDPYVTRGSCGLKYSIVSMNHGAPGGRASAVFEVICYLIIFIFIICLFIAAASNGPYVYHHGHGGYYNGLTTGYLLGGGGGGRTYSPSYSFGGGGGTYTATGFGGTSRR